MDVMMIVYRKNKEYICTCPGIYSLVSIHSNIKYFIFAFVNNKSEKIYKIYIFSYFYWLVAMVTDKLLCASPSHGVCASIIAHFQSNPFSVTEVLVTRWSIHDFVFHQIWPHYLKYLISTCAI